MQILILIIVPGWPNHEPECCLSVLFLSKLRSVGNVLSAVSLFAFVQRSRVVVRIVTI